MGKYVIVILCVAVLSGCHQSSTRALQQTLIFGQGGGVTGIRTEYRVSEDAVLHRRNPQTDSLEILGVWNAAFVKQSFSNFHVLGLDTLVCNEPGDLYYYIQLSTPDTSYSIVWGRPGFKPQPEVVRFFNNLYRSVKPKSQ